MVSEPQSQSNQIIDSDLRRELLDHQIETVKSASKRAISIWVAGSVLAYVVAVATFNAKFSWNRSQLIMRAHILSAFHDEDSLRLVSGEEWVKNILINGEGFLGYFKQLVIVTNGELDYKATFAPERKKTLLDAARNEVNLYAARQVSLDTVKIPIIGTATDITGSDIGIIGGLAVSAMGLWLLACLKREYEAIGEFVIERGKSVVEPAPGTSYSNEENVFAFKCIASSMVFGISSRGSAWVLAVGGIYLIPIGMLVIVHATTLYDVASFKWSYWSDFRNVLELLTCISVAWLWLASLKKQLTILSLIAKWKERIYGV